jgi:hypothetical protein
MAVSVQQFAEGKDEYPMNIGLEGGCPKVWTWKKAQDVHSGVAREYAEQVRAFLARAIPGKIWATLLPSPRERLKVFHRVGQGKDAARSTERCYRLDAPRFTAHRRHPPGRNGRRAARHRAALNHVTGTISGIAAVHNRARYMDEMRDAVEKWDAKVAALVA